MSKFIDPNGPPKVVRSFKWHPIMQDRLRGRRGDGMWASQIVQEVPVRIPFPSRRTYTPQPQMFREQGFQVPTTQYSGSSRTMYVSGRPVFGEDAFGMMPAQFSDESQDVQLVNHDDDEKELKRLLHKSNEHFLAELERRNRKDLVPPGSPSREDKERRLLESLEEGAGTHPHDQYGRLKDFAKGKGLEIDDEKMQKLTMMIMDRNMAATAKQYGREYDPAAGEKEDQREALRYMQAAMTPLSSELVDALVSECNERSGGFSPRDTVCKRDEQTLIAAALLNKEAVHYPSAKDFIEDYDIQFAPGGRDAVCDSLEESKLVISEKLMKELCVSSVIDIDLEAPRLEIQE